MTRPFKRSKFRAKPTNGYASKLEASYAATLEAQRASGEIVDFLEQVPIKLPGGIKYVCDFLILDKDGGWRFVETKGFQTDVFKLKMRLLAEAHPAIYARLELVK